MYVSTTSDSSSVGSAVSSPHFSKLLSNVDRFFRLHPSIEYFSLSIPAYQKMTMALKENLTSKRMCQKKEKSREKRREKRTDKWMKGRVEKGIKTRDQVRQGEARRGRRGEGGGGGERRGEERGERRGKVTPCEARQGQGKQGKEKRGEERRERNNLPPPSHCSFLDFIVPSAWVSSLFCRIKLVFCLTTSGKSTCKSILLVDQSIKQNYLLFGYTYY